MSLHDEMTRDDECRHTQRRMVALLYWRAGETWCAYERTLEHLKTEDPVTAESKLSYALKLRADWLNTAMLANDMQDAVCDEWGDPR